MFSASLRNRDDNGRVLLGIDHHQYMAGTDASLAPGFRTAEEQERSKASETYWAARQTSAGEKLTS